MVWACDCGCECGICEDADCVCECRVLSSVSNTQLKELCIHHGLTTATSQHRRNTLFKIIYKSGDPLGVLRDGVMRYILGQKE